MSQPINPSDVYTALGISSVGFFCVGFIWGMRKETFWIIEWLKVEIDLARMQKRQPRKVKDVEKGIWRP